MFEFIGHGFADQPMIGIVVIGVLIGIGPVSYTHLTLPTILLV